MYYASRLKMKVKTADGIQGQVFTGMYGFRLFHPVHTDTWGTYITTPQVSETEATVNIKTTLVNESRESQESKARNKNCMISCLQEVSKSEATVKN